MDDGLVLLSEQTAFATSHSMTVSMEVVRQLRRLPCSHALAMDATQRVEPMLE